MIQSHLHIPLPTIQSNVFYSVFASGESLLVVIWLEQNYRNNTKTYVCTLIFPTNYENVFVKFKDKLFDGFCNIHIIAQLQSFTYAVSGN